MKHQTDQQAEVEAYDDDGNLIATGAEALKSISALADDMKAEREAGEELAPGALKEAYRRWDELLNSDPRVKAARSAPGGDISELAEELRRQAFCEAFDGAMVRKPPHIPPSDEPGVHARMAAWIASMQTNQSAASVWIAGMTGVAGKTGRQPRERTNGRHRGSRRGERASSSSSDDPGGEGEPPSARPCACGCGRPRRIELDPPDRYYNTNECRRAHARDRQRESRERKLDAPGGGELLWAPTCDCNGGHILERDYDVDVAQGCAKCGRERPWGSLHPFDRIVFAAGRESRQERPGYVFAPSAPAPVGRSWPEHLSSGERKELRRRDRERGYKLPKRRKKATT